MSLDEFVKPTPPAGDQAEVVVYEEGPYLIRGPFVLTASNGIQVSEREVVALCGCGRSRMAPYCDGSHKTGRTHNPHVHPELSAARSLLPSDAGSSTGSSPRI